MPTKERVEAFLALVDEGRTVEAIEAFYTEDAEMQENDAPPRRGRDALLAHERAMLARMPHVRPRLTTPRYWIAGEHVVVRWLLDIETADGKKLVLDELALQTWRGERIARERFYYDSRALRP